MKLLRIAELNAKVTFIAAKDFGELSRGAVIQNFYYILYVL